MSKSSNRRDFIKKATLGVAAVATSGSAMATTIKSSKKDKEEKKPFLRVAHITDVHIRPKFNAEERFKECLKQVEKHDVDFYLNGGDTIWAADYGHIKEDFVLEQWAVWDRCIKMIGDKEIYSCLGNHDMWWAAPGKKENPMWGKPYVVKRTKAPARYYHVDKGTWHFLVLDSNNKGASFDKEQLDWMVNKLETIPSNEYILIMTHHPIFGVTSHFEGGMNKEFKKMIKLFYQHPNVKVCLSGHNHLFDDVLYNGVNYFCNGAVSGTWWNPNLPKDGIKPNYYKETPPGYAIVDLYDDGTVTNTYYTYQKEVESFTKQDDEKY